MGIASIGLLLGPWTGRDDLDEVESRLRHGVDAGVHVDA
jgi:hypothetical protein